MYTQYMKTQYTTTMIVTTVSNVCCMDIAFHNDSREIVFYDKHCMAISAGDGVRCQIMFQVYDIWKISCHCVSARVQYNEFVFDTSRGRLTSHDLFSAMQE